MKNIKKYAIFAIFLAFLAIPNISLAALTQSQINAITSLLQSFGVDQKTMVNVQSILSGAPTSSTTTWCYDFNFNLKIGNTGNEVATLHIALEKEGFSIGSEEKNNQEFGEFTASAVSGFQEKYKSEILTPLGLRYGTFFVGLATRAKLNSLYGCGIISTITPSITVLSPNGGEICKRNEVCNVSYKLNLNGSNTNRWISVGLYKGNDFKVCLLLSSLTPPLASKGSLNWNISSSQENGDNFKIKISVFKDRNAFLSESPEVFDLSDGHFSIQ